MAFYDESRPSHLETDESGIGLGAALLQIRDGMICLYEVKYLTTASLD